jgi:hypothetical protein
MSETPNKFPTCLVCGCRITAGEYCFEHKPYMVWPLADGTFRSDRFGRRHVSIDDLGDLLSRAEVRTALEGLPRYVPSDVARESKTGKPASPLVGIWRDANSGTMPVIKWVDVEALIRTLCGDQSAPTSSST